MTERDQQAVSQFVERFGAAMADSGMARMPARILAALLATDSGRLNAAEIADLLQISPAAVSGAVRYLGQLNLVTREREPGSRRDYYRMRDDAWYEASIKKDSMWKLWEETLEEGIAAVGEKSPAGIRLGESLEFFRFFHAELPAMLGRWRAHRAKWLESQRS
ncbi:MarR family transcriptional regulator [Lentzea sp. NBRC 105346]|uniref:GbsR/MarR family transcriptional regulator n=1 Tax=Lentzea sp. NBRC 105346 TaxID=3032205 RepID=UPI0024A2B9D5|nr:MarR family transcriptional regulator [Lentzea sp. NBRC 105346]GLZ31577.1 MarR family transcriptional regulator [Lentzea sp. NBRC 105346]